MFKKSGQTEEEEQRILVLIDVAEPGVRDVKEFLGILERLKTDSSISLAFNECVHYATALDWFLVMSFGFVMATLLEFASVHYFTKVGSGERGEAFGEEEEWEEPTENRSSDWTRPQKNPNVNCSIVYNDHRHFGWRSPVEIFDTPSKSMESKETQTEKKMSCFSQFLRCVVADETFRRERQKAAAGERSTNSVSKIDKISRVLFPLSFFFLNCFYWGMYSYLHDTCELKNHPQPSFRSP
ncbi:unnamed protein product [Allacma fusca]|uniref:Neurotransmitter-gated ion-channel transmembrane domain-containing protein n=1 Tax=Allacma fusca TaxID=39272 RepID=A0A8J2KUP5_9HEXA|nr:unnamed protein product [Allacma fusca]